MKFTLEIELGNDAMQSGLALSAAVYEVAHRIESLYGSHPVCNSEGTYTIMDENGNSVGTWEVG